MPDVRENIYGRNAVFEVLRAGRREVHEIRVARGVKDDARLSGIASAAETSGIRLIAVERTDLDQETDHHQGVSALVSPYPYVPLTALVEHASKTVTPPFYLILDQLQDPRNFGALLRTADAVGVNGVIIPEHRSTGVTPVVVAASAGASEHQFIARSNIVQAIKQLKDAGVWFVGLVNSDAGQSLYEIDASGAVAIVLGHEGQGIRRLVAESCDYLARIPMHGRIDSLNVSVAGSVAMYYVLSCRT
jgi:23S rRNA (guanosine2251-2'-O)-methyltransferase